MDKYDSDFIAQVSEINRLLSDRKNSGKAPHNKLTRPDTASPTADTASLSSSLFPAEETGTATPTPAVTATSTPVVSGYSKTTKIIRDVPDGQEIEETTVTPFGEQRPPTGFEALIGFNPTRQEKRNRYGAYGLTENGELPDRNFWNDHPNFNFADYLNNIAQNTGYPERSPVMDFFQVPLGKEKDSLDKAYANAGYDQAVQNLINDIVFYKLSSDNIKDAYNNGEVPIRRADDLANSYYGRIGLFGKHMENYSRPVHPSAMNVDYQRDIWREQYGKDKVDEAIKETERDVYRRIAKLNKDQHR